METDVIVTYSKNDPHAATVGHVVRKVDQDGMRVMQALFTDVNE
jgi:hypothetical protein